MLSGVVYVSLNLLSTAPLSSYETLTDRWARPLPVYVDGGMASGMEEKLEERDGERKEELQIPPPLRPPPPSVPHFADLDIGVVNDYLYGDKEKRRARMRGRRG